jgi:hypothetical protein
VAVVDEPGAWRTHWTMAEAFAGSGGRYQKSRYGAGPRSALPPAGWTQPDFDDSTWSARPSVGVRDDAAGSLRLAVVSARARFEVADPGRVGRLRARVAYHGGCVVALNGREVARAHLPAGPVTHETLAEDYPVEAFMRPDGSAPLPQPSKDVGRAFAGRYALRVRTLCADLPARDLRAGANVLAVQIVRSAYREEPLRFNWWGVTQTTIWSTGALLRASLNASAPDGLRLQPPPPAETSRTKRTWLWASTLTASIRSCRRSATSDSVSEFEFRISFEFRVSSFEFHHCIAFTSVLTCTS